MPGANYMGGKRNAARARIKDTEGKAQRSHFGKKRFEVLRTGLSKTITPRRDIRREPPEITLAHARRRRAQNQEEVNDEHEWERKWVGLRSPSTSPVLPLRSPPVNTVSRRSKVLTILDADNPAMQRAQVRRILQTPDLLGLSTTRGLVSRREAAKARSRTSDEPVRTQRSSFTRHVPQRSPSLEGSPSSKDSSHSQRTHFPHPTPQEPAIISSSKCSSCLSSQRAESIFIPMFLDSSPSPYADDSGYAEFRSDPYRDYEVTRVPFYPQPSNKNQQYSITSSVSGRAMFSSPTAHSRSSSAERLSQFSALSRSPSRRLSYATASPSHLELPPLMEEQFVSDLVGPLWAPEATKSSHLSLSNSSQVSVSCSELAGRNVFSPPDVPQASFSLSPPCLARCNSAEEGTYTPSKGSSCSSQDSYVHSAPQDIPWSTAKEDAIEWDYVCLEDILGGLFEDADPWNALSKLLDLPSSPVGPSGIDEDILALLGPSDRRGVGYTAPGSPSSLANLATSQTLVDACREDYPPLDFNSVVSPGPPPNCEGNCASRQARRPGVEAKFAEPSSTKIVAPLGSSPSPRCSRSGDMRSPSWQPSVMSLADRDGTIIQMNQTAKLLEAPGNGGDFTNEDLHTADSGSRCITFHSESDDDMELVNGPSLFDDEFWCSEE